jgi:hypothetical protein
MIKILFGSMVVFSLGVGCNRRASAVKYYPTTQPKNSELVGTYHITTCPEVVGNPRNDASLTLNADNSFAMVSMPGWDDTRYGFGPICRGKVVSGSGDWRVALQYDVETNYYRLTLEFKEIGSVGMNFADATIGLKGKHSPYQILIPTDHERHEFIVLSKK